MKDIYGRKIDTEIPAKASFTQGRPARFFDEYGRTEGNLNHVGYYKWKGNIILELRNLPNGKVLVRKHRKPIVRGAEID